MPETIDYQGKIIEIRRRAFQKRLGISVYPNGQIRVSANKSISQREILKFIGSQNQWLHKAMSEAERLRQKYPPKSFRDGELYPYLGTDYKLSVTTGESLSLKIAGDAIIFTTPLPEENWDRQLRQRYFEAFRKSYRQVAQQIMGRRIEYYSKKMRLHPTAVQFRGQKSIWGSCSPENKISLNYKLIVAPIEVVDYVMIHELAHIKHKNHSKAFWSLVERYTEHRHFSRRWLREHQYKADFLAKESELNSF